MAHIATLVWDAMGWCPMHAAPRELPPAAGTEELKKSSTGDSGPVARRSARFMRLTWGVVILSWILAFLALPHLPEVIPIHWGLYGEANGFADKVSGILGLPVAITLVMVLMIVLPRFHSVEFSLEAFRDIYAMLIFATIAMIFAIEAMVIVSALGVDLPVVTIISLLMGFLFIVMGGLMPHIGRNTTMGIRLPWTLASEDVWNRTHEYGGRIFMAAGVLVVLGSLVAGIWAMALMLVVILGSTLYISIWSYRLAKSMPGSEGKLCS
jgi:uncharacterized membrane protein